MSVLRVLGVLLLLCAQDFFKNIEDEATTLGVWYRLKIPISV